VAHLLDQAEIEVGDDEFVLVAAAHRNELPSRSPKVALAVDMADVPGFLDADAVDRADEVSVCDSVRGLFQLPQILGEPGDGCRRVHDDFGAVDAQNSCAYGEMPVVANVDAHHPSGRVEHRIAQVAGTKIELLPEARRDVRD